jgi:hypothetical protein
LDLHKHSATSRAKLIFDDLQQTEMIFSDAEIEGATSNCSCHLLNDTITSSTSSHRKRFLTAMFGIFEAYSNIIDENFPTPDSETETLAGKKRNRGKSDGVTE